MNQSKYAGRLPQEIEAVYLYVYLTDGTSFRCGPVFRARPSKADDFPPEQASWRRR